ncbi:serine/threonine protein phosphatase [Paenibacillus darwinianus]|uniref:Serine/threonine protein phosphatase n=1 Tax=Paenibacillus darwinianus TaxID=1380763 RepID=A0A9W5RZR2_9BACL|nr:Stp1/IreP family PP2C-type Ser/Thr phosphatase [Paenibacillus darwinianus]EXX84727.1 serine/threonine protein phosphatase [Paenibacillus darwinianus]EXX85160.1 serine/threonine protein phosphatase [Paenibacillus darwinianus]EXX89687.1 serine/threonine protein phosphatase [Paenibacillus darwinianus]
MRTANRSDIGRIRLVNEDRAWVGQLENGITVAIVADGMGGHQAGDVASQLAVDTFRESLRDYKDPLDPEQAKTLIRQAILQANEIVYEMASQNDRYHNMGTTVVAAMLFEGSGIIGHIGDSRAYRLHDGRLRLLTEDHTLVNELAKSGQISAEEAANHPRRNVLTRALGTDRHVEVDVKGFAWTPGDMLLLCSDGLYSMVGEDEMLAALLDAEPNLDGKAERLIELALHAGGDDNVTVLLIDHAAGDEEEVIG